MSLTAITETAASDIIDKYSSDKTTIKEFKNSLNKFVKDISPSDEEGNTKPLILFIDELDRCRPDFAIELLEKAKHFFNIDNIIFVLALDKEQIGHSIRSMYGVGMNVDGYLRRFIDLDYNLPEPSTDNFCRELFDKLDLTKYFEERTQHELRHDRGHLLTTLTELFKVFGFSLREQEQCLSRLSIVLKTTPIDRPIHPILLGTLISLKTANPKLYTDYVKGTKNVDNILNFISDTPTGENFINSDRGETIKGYLIYAQYDSNNSEQHLKLYQAKSKDDTVSYEKRERAAIMLSQVNELITRNRYSPNILKSLAKKIEIAEQFIQN